MLSLDRLAAKRLSCSSRDYFFVPFGLMWTEVIRIQFMFTTTFINNKLTVDSSKFDAVVSYLNQFNCKYESLRYGSGKCVFWIDEAPESVIESLTRKFNQVDERFEYLSQLHDDDLTVILGSFLEMDMYFAACEVWGDMNAVWNVVKDCLPSLQEMIDYMNASPCVDDPSFDFQDWVNNFDVSTGTVSQFIGLSDRQSIKAKYRELAKSMHPDVGGDASEFAELSKQYQRALQLVNA